MFRKSAVALITVLVTTASMLTPLTAAGAVASGWDAVVPAPSGDAFDGDHDPSTRVRVDIDPAADSARIGLPGSPDLVVLEQVPTGSLLAVRSRDAGGWTEWQELEASNEDAPDGTVDGSTAVVGPLWIGTDSTAIEVAILTGLVRRFDVVGLHSRPVSSPSHSGRVQSEARPLSAANTTTTTTTTTTTSTTTTTTPDGEPTDPQSDPDAAPGPADEASGDPSDEPVESVEPRVDFAPDGAFIRPRSAWATEDMTWNCDTGPHEAEELRAAVVHHTAGTVDYTAADVPGIIRGIWNYRARTRGWCDIAYNFMVDKFGGIWEARQGGIGRAIIGGHTRGFNTSTVGIAQLGDFNTAWTPTPMSAATRRLLAWKLGIHGVDPLGETTVTNRTGDDFHGVPDEGEVPTATVVGHRDLGSTSCPGHNTYGTIESLRTKARDGVHAIGLFQTFLQSPPTPAGFAPWSSIADEKGVATAAVAMARSEAYSGLIIDDLYQRVLGRPADDQGKAYWLELLASGMRVEDVGVQFYGSQEFFDSMGSIEGYVAALYENLLHREPEERGLEFWSGKLRDRTALPPDIAEGFYLSVESRRDRVVRLYESILGRTPEAQGRDYWADQLLDTDDVLLAVDLALSNEFYERVTT